MSMVNIIKKERHYWDMHVSGNLEKFTMKGVRIFLKSYRTENDRNGQERCHQPKEEDCEPALGPGQEPNQLEWVDHNNVPE